MTPTEWGQAHHANALFDTHRDVPEVDYHYLHEEAVTADVSMSARTVWKLCCVNAWWPVFGKKRGKNGKRPGPPVHNDLLATINAHGGTRHAFLADHPNQISLSDITERRTSEGKL